MSETIFLPWMRQPCGMTWYLTQHAVEKRGAHSVNLKSTGHEKSKITVCLSATADGGKKKAFHCV